MADWMAREGAAMNDNLTGLAALELPKRTDETEAPESDAAAVGSRVAAARRALGISGTALGELVDLRKDQISKIESGRRRLDVSELPRFAAALGVTVRHLLGQSERPALALAARLAVGADAGAVGPLRQRARHILEVDDLLTQVTALPPARPSDQGLAVIDTARKRFDSVSTQSEARRQGRDLAELTRQALDLGSDAIGDLPALIEQHFAVDVALSRLGTDVDGLCAHRGSAALILASSDLPDGRMRFTLAHELCHHILGDPREIIEEGECDMFADSPAEQRANAFAGHFLMPPRGLRSVLTWLGEADPHNVSERSVVALMEHFGVSLAALVYQLNILRLLSYEEGQVLRGLGVAKLVARHRDVAPTGAAAQTHHVQRPPERLIRYALAAVREQQVGLGPVASLLEKRDDEMLWAEVMADDTAAVTEADILL